MTRAASIDMGAALDVFACGEATPRDVATACNVATGTAIWFIRAMERRGVLTRVKPSPFCRYPDFGIFKLADGNEYAR